MFKIVSVSIALAAIASPAAADPVVAAPAVQSAGAPKAADQAKKSDLDKVVCKEQDEIGSRLQNHLVCLTVGQWNDLELRWKENVRDMEQRTTGKSGGG